MRSKEFITEYRRGIIDHLYKLLPKWPQYVVRDWLYQSFSRKEFTVRSDIDGTVDELLGMFGVDADTQWKLVQFNFKMGIWEPQTEEKLRERMGTSAVSWVPNDEKRHQTQAKLASQEGGIRREPVIIIDTPQGYDLVEGWHRTIQHFKMNPGGYKGPAWLAKQS
jgi:hypothetical protein